MYVLRCRPPSLHVGPACGSSWALLPERALPRGSQSGGRGPAVLRRPWQRESHPCGAHDGALFAVAPPGPEKRAAAQARSPDDHRCEVSSPCRNDDEFACETTVRRNEKSAGKVDRTG